MRRKSPNCVGEDGARADLLDRDKTNVVGPAGQAVARKWNEELFALLESIAPECTRF